MNMKIKNRLFLLITAMAVMSSSAFAATTATQTFTANVTAGTCTIAKLDQTFDLGLLNKAELTTKDWAIPSDGRGFVVTSFDVTGCPNATTKVKVTPSFSPDSTYDYLVLNKGTARGIHFSTNYGSGKQWHNNQSREFTLTNGAVQVPFTGSAERSKSNAVSTGTLDFQLAFTFDFR
ncbi:type 1 fimbrial protein [Salmonella enterica subsp. enterica]|nr:type 1 fimbrial protein [Salmonella enterica subsp. enterica serovar Abony]